MTAQELITELQRFDPETLVVIHSEKKFCRMPRKQPYCTNLYKYTDWRSEEEFNESYEIIGEEDDETVPGVVL